ncbi:UDP-glucuronosyltransferase 2A1 isoform X2 [Amia ocellicauda]|uniref:UDP-glucuronosyltransferase 2A1 isoform X2 n=1 Tax=Amia ocellicauda TaxID=2972642 RepID=UPI0034643900
MWLFPAATHTLLALLMSVMSTCHGSRILVYPVDGSHWVNMNILLRGLHERGHNLTVVRSSTSWYISEKAPHYTSITIQLPQSLNLESHDYMASYLRRNLEIRRGEGSPLAFIALQREVIGMLNDAHRMSAEMVLTMFEDQALIKRLQDAQFDLVLTDPGFAGGVLVGHYLQLPLVFNVRWITNGEGHFAIAPSPLSYVPTIGSRVSDKMDFIQKAKNILHYGIGLYIDHVVTRPHYQVVCDRYFDPDVNIYSLMQGADLWLMRLDFVFEFPRPTMPNVVYIGGFQCQPSKPLDPELEAFVQSSGEHGIIIMSLGTLVNGLPMELTEKIAAAFSQLPQKVIWRHLGERPSNLGNNTLLVKWMPQNDLLGHPKTRAFVAHGGTNGIYEAIYHGVPIVGIPLIFDQFDNMIRLEARGVAKVLEVTTLETVDLLQALLEVMEDPVYHGNMQRLSRLHHDQPMKPLDTAFFWIEYVIRNKGAKHLRTESYRMPWKTSTFVHQIRLRHRKLLQAGMQCCDTKAGLLGQRCKQQRTERNMASSFTANQYENAFKSNRLQNWTVPKQYKESGSAGGSFVGTWEMPLRIPPAHVSYTGRSVEGAAKLKTWIEGAASGRSSGDKSAAGTAGQQTPVNPPETQHPETSPRPQSHTEAPASARPATQEMTGSPQQLQSPEPPAAEQPSTEVN